MDCALQLIDLKEGDEVIIPSFTIVSGLSAILRTKATPVFCDVDESTWNMRLDHVEEKYTTKTKAVILVHTYGLPAEGKKLRIFVIKTIYFLLKMPQKHMVKMMRKKMWIFWRNFYFKFLCK